MTFTTWSVQCKFFLIISYFHLVYSIKESHVLYTTDKFEGEITIVLRKIDFLTPYPPCNVFIYIYAKPLQTVRTELMEMATFILTLNW